MSRRRTDVKEEVRKGGVNNRMEANNKKIKLLTYNNKKQN